MPRSKSTITYKKKDSIAIVSMNRPEFNNAQNGKMTYDLDKAFKKAIDDDDIKVIILKGNGKRMFFQLRGAIQVIRQQAHAVVTVGRLSPIDLTDFV